MNCDYIYRSLAAEAMPELLRLTQLLMGLHPVVWIAKFNRVIIHVFSPNEIPLFTPLPIAFAFSMQNHVTKLSSQ
jgi:hypothetical protein